MDLHAGANTDFAERSGGPNDDDDVPGRPYAAGSRALEHERLRAAEATAFERHEPGFRMPDSLRRLLRPIYKYSRAGGVYRELRPRAAGSGLGLDDDSDGHHSHHGAPSNRPPSCMDTVHELLFSSWLNWMLLFVPVGIFAYLVRLNSIAVFAANAIAVIPLSSLLTAATEKVASDAGDTVGALLNISLGNLVELILFIVALVNNQIRVVQASILGSILVNSLLILGSALLATGLTDNEPSYNTAESQLLSCLLLASVFVFLMPTAFGYTFDHSTSRVSKATLQMSRVSSVMVLLIYLIYFVHELRTQPLRNRASHCSDSLEEGSAESEFQLMPPAHHVAHGHNIPAPANVPLRTIRFADERGDDVSAYNGAASAVAAGSAGTAGTAAAAAVKATPTTGDLGSGDLGAFHTYDGANDDVESRGRPSEDSGAAAGARVRARSGSNGRPSSAYSAYARSRLNGQSHARSISVDSNHGHGTRGRASSLSGLAGLPGRPGLGAPLMQRSGLAALQIMRESRTSLESTDMSHLGLLRPMPPRRPPGEFAVAVLVLIVASGLMSVNAQFLVDTIDDVTHQGHLSESVIGLIILPIVGNIAEYVTVVSVALRDKLDLAISVAIGSSIQIALCVTPLTVGAGWILGRNLSLTFSVFEMAALVGTALLVGSIVSSDGDRKLRTCGLKGALMCACYVIIGFGAYLSPNVQPKST